jgi:cobalt/nickel transport system ATP-binding protein
VLVVEQLSFVYPDGRRALDGVSFALASGEKVAMLGPNGAGKSTLTLCLNGVLPGQGEVRLGDVRLQKSTLHELRARVGLVFQNPDDQLFCPTVGEDVAFGPACQGLGKEEVAQRVKAALAAVGLEGYGDRIPQHLSGGEKKRAALATVLAMQPELLVVDEPSAGLDPRSRRQLIDTLQSLPMALLIATHDLPLVDDVCSRALVLDQGKVVADGPWGELRAQDELLRQHGLVA